MSIKSPVLDPLATFVDVGSEHMHVSIEGDQPKVFGTDTSQLHALTSERVCKTWGRWQGGDPVPALSGSV